MKNLFKNVRGFKPTEQLFLVGISLLIASGVIFGMSGNNAPAPDVNVNVQPPEVNVYVDGQRMAASSMQVPTASAGHLPMPTFACGNYEVTPGEQCDDGNTLSGDGCSATCQVEVSCPGAISGNTCTLSPYTGLDHKNGVQDASNLQSALYWAKGKTDGTVHLTSGDFYVSRNIVVDGFDGTLEGAGMNSTTIKAGRRSPAAGDGFSFAFHPFWAAAGYWPFIPTVLQLDNSTGHLEISGFTMEVVGKEPTDLIPDYYGNFQNAIGTMIDIQAGDNTTDFHDVRLKGAPASSSPYGKNVSYGFHDMDGPNRPAKKSLLTITNVEAENIGYALLAMDWESVDINNITAKNVSGGLFAAANSNTTVENSLIEATDTALDIRDVSGAVVNNNTINMIGSEGLATIGVWWSPNAKITNNTITGRSQYGVNIWPAESSGALVQGNTFKDSWSNFGQISLEESNNSIVRRNTFINTTGNRSGGIAILWPDVGGNVIEQNKFVNVSSAFGFGAIADIWGVNTTIRNNDYTESGLPGWDVGEGAIGMRRSTGSKTIESVGVSGTTFPSGSTLCDHVWDLYGSNNKITGYQACENRQVPEDLQSELDALKAELEANKAEKQQQGDLHRK